jgi:2,4-dienoyl-CoA reductase-like NADH-dependent reductase (Old Yellow Enzyme family)
VPLKELAAAERDRVRRIGMRLASPWILRGWPFEEAFFRPMASQFLHAVDVPLMLLGGVTRLETMTSALDEGFGFVAMARALLHDPNLPNMLASGSAGASACDHNNRCVVTMEHGGTRCVLREATEARSAP